MLSACIFRLVHESNDRAIFNSPFHAALLERAHGLDKRTLHAKGLNIALNSILYCLVIDFGSSCQYRIKLGLCSSIELISNGIAGGARGCGGAR